MNKARYENLPTDLKAAIDANSGLKPAADAGAIWDNEAEAVTDLVRKRKNTIASLPEESVKAWRGAVDPIYANWAGTLAAGTMAKSSSKALVNSWGSMKRPEGYV